MNEIKLEPGEKLIRIVDEHWFKYVWPVSVSVLLAVISLALFYLWGLSAHHVLWVSEAAFFLGTGLATFTLHWFFVMLLSEASDMIIITDRRLIRVTRRFYFYEDVQEVAFSRLRSVEARKKGLLQNTLRFGSLIFDNGTVITLVPHPNWVAADIERSLGMK